MIVYGGTDDTGQVFDGFSVLSLPVSTAAFASSSPLVPDIRPVARHLHSAIHDPLGPRMVMLAGHDNDTTSDGSALSGEAWTLHPTAGYAWVGHSFVITPPLRAGHSAVYDALNQRMVIFGSSNWTSSSAAGQVDHNIFTTKPDLVSWYITQFERKWNKNGGVIDNIDFVPLPPNTPVNPVPAVGATGLSTTVTL